jgi:hypothetical protein
MRMIVEQLVEWRLAGETEVLRENLPQRHFPACSTVPRSTMLPHALHLGKVLHHIHADPHQLATAKHYSQLSIECTWNDADITELQSFRQSPYSLIMWMFSIHFGIAQFKTRVFNTMVHQNAWLWNVIASNAQNSWIFQQFSTYRIMLELELFRAS